MKYSEELLMKYAGKKMTLSQKQELREALRYEQEQERKLQQAAKDIIKNFEDDTFNPLDMPEHRHLGKNPNWLVCPICRKIRGYDLGRVKDYNAIQAHPDDFCLKPHIHTDWACNMLIQRERIDLDEKADVRV